MIIIIILLLLIVLWIFASTMLGGFGGLLWLIFHKRAPKTESEYGTVRSDMKTGWAEAKRVQLEKQAARKAAKEAKRNEQRQA